MKREEGRQEEKEREEGGRWEGEKEIEEGGGKEGEEEVIGR